MSLPDGTFSQHSLPFILKYFECHFNSRSPQATTSVSGETLHAGICSLSTGGSSIIIDALSLFIAFAGTPSSPSPLYFHACSKASLSLPPRLRQTKPFTSFTCGNDFCTLCFFVTLVGFVFPVYAKISRRFAPSNSTTPMRCAPTSPSLSVFAQE